MDGQQFFKHEEFQQIEKQSPFGWRGMVGLSVPEWRLEHFALQAWMRVISWVGDTKYFAGISKCDPWRCCAEYCQGIS